MKQKILLLMCAVMLVFGATGAAAYNLEIVPGGPVDVTGESTVFFDVVFNPQGTVDVGTYTFNMFYDDTELTWNSELTTTSAPSPLFSQFLGDLNGTTPGFIGNFNAAGFSGDATLSSSFTLSQLAFDVTSPVLDGSADVWFDTTADSRFGFTVDGSSVLMSDMPISGTGPDVYSTPVVPEPVSMVLFGVGSVVLAGRRIVKRRHG